MLDLKLNTIYVSPSIEKKLGFTPEERMCQEPREQMTLDSFKRVMDGLKEEFKREQENGVDPERIIKIEVEYYHKNGFTIWFENLVSGIRDENGTLCGIHGVSRDITERKKAEDKLREGQQFLKNVFDAIQDGISVLERDLNITLVNQWIEKMYASEKPLINRKCYEVYQKRETSCPWCPSLPAMEQGVIQSSVVPYPSEDNPIGWIELTAFPLKNNEGHIIGVIEHVKDITKRKKYEQKLKESEQKYKNLSLELESIIESLPLLFYYKDLNGNVIRVNKLIADSLNMSIEDVIGKNILDLYPEAIGKKFLKDDLEVIISGKAKYNIEEPYKTPEGTRWLNTNKIPSYNENGEIIGVIGCSIDITERKNAKKKIEKAFNQSNFYKDLLAHDMGNVLNNIKFSTQIIEMWKDDYTKSDKKEKMMGIIKQQLERGESLISNVRKLSEIEGKDYVTTSVDIKSMLESAIEQVRSRFQKKKIDIKTELLHGIVNVKGGDLLLDAFENILLNGGIHNDNDKIQLWIKISKIQKEGKNFVKIEFKDNGTGIIEARKKTIFNRNYKKDRSKGGMGIGLSLVKNIIDGYGGQVWVENRVEGDNKQGSNFIVLLKEA